MSYKVIPVGTYLEGAAPTVLTGSGDQFGNYANDRLLASGVGTTVTDNGANSTVVIAFSSGFGDARYVLSGVGSPYAAGSGLISTGSVYHVQIGSGLYLQNDLVGFSTSFGDGRYQLSGTGAPGSGETNTASNIGSGIGVWKQKTGVNLEFKSILAGSGLTISGRTDEVYIMNSGLISKVKTVNTSRQSTTSVAIDPDLQFPITSGRKYSFRMEAYYTTPAAADFRCTLNSPGGASVALNGAFKRTTVAPGATAFANIVINSGLNHNGGGNLDITTASTLPGYVTYGGIFTAVVTSSVGFYWAQVSSTASDTTVYAGSYIDWMEIV